jgi:hypothetical protein
MPLRLARAFVVRLSVLLPFPQQRPREPPAKPHAVLSYVNRCGT